MRVILPADVTGDPDTLNSAARPLNVSPTLVTNENPISAATSARKVGAAAAPVVGPASTVFAVCVFHAIVSVPAVVTGEPVTAN